MSTMPITPGPAAPAPATDLLAAAGGAVALGNVPASETGAGFLALVQQALHLVDGQAEVAVDAEPSAKDGENTESTDPQVDLTSLLPFPSAIPITATPAAQAKSGSDGGEGDPAVSRAVTAAAPAAATPAGPVVAESAAAATAETGPSAPRPEAPAPAGVVDGSGTHAATKERSALSAPAEVGAASPGTTAPEAPVTPTATAPTGSVVSPAPTTKPAADPITTQVVDRITSLVSRGNGTHRITMTLNPEQLGEVRVVMTMREGSVHVRLAASEPQAHQALLNGSPELSRLLEVAGASEARVSVREVSRDLGQGSADFSTANGSSTPDQGTGQGRASDRSTDEYAGTRADHPATDGAHNPRRFAAGPTGHRSNESVTSSRATGLDVTI